MDLVYLMPACRPVRVTVGSVCICTCYLNCNSQRLSRPDPKLTLEPTVVSINRFLLLGPARTASFLRLVPKVQ